MRIVFAPIGTRGDVQQLLALAGRMRTRGQECLFVAPEPSCGLIQSQGFQATALAWEISFRSGSTWHGTALAETAGCASNTNF